MQTIAYGFKLPETGDTGDAFFAALAQLIQQVANHNHDGNTSSALATVTSLGPDIVGTEASPTGITAAGGIPFTSNKYQNLRIIKGSGGPVDITAVPQIAAATLIGQRLTLVGWDNVDTVKLEDGNGLFLNGPWIGGLGSTLELMWTGSVWVEMTRSE